MTAVAVTISGYAESAQRAVHGVLLNRDKVKQLHFVYPAYQSDTESMYAEWPKDRVALEKAGIQVFFDATLDAKYFNSDTDSVIEINPYCELKSGAFATIQSTLKATSHEQTHVALATATKLNRFSLWYGFIIVLTVIDWLWNRIGEHNKLMQYTDVVARFIVRKGQVASLPRPSVSWRLWNPHVVPKIYAGETALNCPPESEEGFQYTSWLLYTHKHLGFGLWMFPFALAWFVLSSSWFGTFYSVLFTRSLVMGTYAMGTWLMEITVAWLICGHYLQLNYKNVFYVLFPFYLLAFPFFLLYCKMSTPQKTWK